MSRKLLVGLCLALLVLATGTFGYLAANEDLSAAGIDNERDAIIHYLNYGRNEGRKLRED